MPARLLESGTIYKIGIANPSIGPRSSFAFGTLAWKKKYDRLLPEYAAVEGNSRARTACNHNPMNVALYLCEVAFFSECVPPGLSSVE